MSWVSDIFDWGTDLVGGLFDGPYFEASGPASGYHDARDDILGDDVFGPITYEVTKPGKKPSSGGFWDDLFSGENVLSLVGGLGESYLQNEAAEDDKRIREEEFAQTLERDRLAHERAMELVRLKASLTPGVESKWNPARDRYEARMNALKIAMEQRSNDSRALGEAYKTAGNLISAGLRGT